MNPKIIGAFLLGAILIGLSFYSAEKKNHLPIADASLGVVAGGAPEKTYIQIEDKNQNGIPDWRENLRAVRTVPFNAATGSATTTVPDTLTAEFAIDLFQDLIRKDAYAPFGGTTEEIVAEAGERILGAASDKLFTERDVTIQKNYSSETLKNYGNQVAEIAQINGVPSDTENEAVITKNALMKSDPSALEPLNQIEQSYQGMLDQMLDLPVPEPLLIEHLNLINTYNALLIDVQAMKMAFEDPLFTMVRVKRYEDDAIGLYNALNNLYAKLQAQGVRYGENDLARLVFYFLAIW